MLANQRPKWRWRHQSNYILSSSGLLLSNSVLWSEDWFENFVRLTSDHERVSRRATLHGAREKIMSHSGTTAEDLRMGAAGSALTKFFEQHFLDNILWSPSSGHQFCFSGRFVGGDITEVFLVKVFDQNFSEGSGSDNYWTNMEPVFMKGRRKLIRKSVTYEGTDWRGNGIRVHIPWAVCNKTTGIKIFRQVKA